MDMNTKNRGSNVAFKKTLKVNEALELPDGNFIRNTSKTTISITYIKKEEFKNIEDIKNSEGVKTNGNEKTK